MMVGTFTVHLIVPLMEQTVHYFEQVQKLSEHNKLLSVHYLEKGSKIEF